jgi:hypothetical protein
MSATAATEVWCSKLVLGLDAIKGLHKELDKKYTYESVFRFDLTRELWIQICLNLLRLLAYYWLTHIDKVQSSSDRTKHS